MKRNQISETLYWLKGFANKIDENDDFSENAMLFYRKCNNGKYIVINHFKRKDRIEFQGFDSWICDYRVNAEPGVDSPIEMKQIKLGLKLPEDLSLLEQYY